MSELDKPRIEDTFIVNDKIDFIPVLENVAPASEEELLQYMNKLRQYFLHGQKTDVSLKIDVPSGPLSPYFHSEILEMDFPFLYKQEENKIQSLYDLLKEMISNIFDTKEAEVLNQQLPGIIKHILEKETEEGNKSNFKSQIKIITEVVRLWVDHFPDAESFKNHCNQFEESLLKKERPLIDFSGLTTFQLLSPHLQRRNKLNLAFLDKLRRAISGLNEILVLQSDQSVISKSNLDFAGDLLSFDKIKDLSLPAVSSNLSKTRLNRLQNCLNTLLKARAVYSESATTVIVSKELNEEFYLSKTLKEASIKLTSENAVTEARNFYKAEIQAFVRTIADLRIAELEINQQYQEKIHAPYFESFDETYLSDDDIRYFRSIVIIEEGPELMEQAKDFLALFSEGAHIKLLAINKLDEIINPILHESHENTYLELASLAIFRRNACVYQGGADNPHLLDETFHKGMKASSPVLWNILLTKPDIKNRTSDYIALKSAIESRYFPRFNYEILSGKTFSSHFDISNNVQFDQLFPFHNIVTNTQHGKENLQYFMTMADFLATKDNILEIVEIVPPRFRSKNLISLAEYFSLTQDSLAGKIPFIWVVDENNHLLKAVIPISWLGKCRSRIDYWQFIQEMGGMDHAHWDGAINEAKSVWESEKEAEIEKIKKQLQEEFDQIRTKDLERAVKKMLYRLIGSKDQINNARTQTENPINISEHGDKNGHTPISDLKEKELTQKQEAPILEKEINSEIKKEVWIESEDCTSCSDCIDALPSVFKYNKEKLAIVHNPQGGPYAKIVAAAEKCPAMCIHPGLPHDPKEKNLEKLLKRAEKFN